ncbi:MAG: HAMP domain-containing sensor histidine kinase [Planctomycetota bacterium]
MKPPRRRGWVPWAVYAVASLIVLEVVGWSSWRIVTAERAQRAAEAESAVDQRLRLALWRMDSLVVPLLVLESSRTAAGGAAGVDPADPVRLRAQLNTDGSLSPAERNGATPADAARRARDSQALERLVDPEVLRAAAAASLETRATFRAAPRADRTIDEAAQSITPRQRAADLAIAAASGPEPIGAFRAMWVEEELLLVRGVAGGSVRAQVLWIDWPRLRGALLAEAAPLLPGLGLEPRPAGEAIGPSDLATIPVRAITPAPMVEHRIGSATVVSLAATWAAVLAGLLAIGVVLYLSRRLAEQRWRFAAAVTHELRTPLTALRLNTELLERATDDAVRTKRSQAVSRDARRLSSVVESVLAFARVGSAAGDPGRWGGVDQAIEASVRTIEPAATEAGIEIGVGKMPDATAALVAIDGSALERIIGNLLENAVRHARSRVSVSAVVEGRSVRIAVEDDGPGVPPGERRRAIAYGKACFLIANLRILYFHK